MTADQEESLLQQLTEITRVMQEGQLMEGMTPEKKAQDNWEGQAGLFGIYVQFIWTIVQHTIYVYGNLESSALFYLVW